MSRKNLRKPDNFYFLFVVVMIASAFFVVYVFKVIFDAVRVSADIGAQFTEVELKIDTDKLNRAVKVATEKKVLQLEVR